MQGSTRSKVQQLCSCQCSIQQLCSRPPQRLAARLAGWLGVPSPAAAAAACKRSAVGASPHVLPPSCPKMATTQVALSPQLRAYCCVGGMGGIPPGGMPMPGGMVGSAPAPAAWGNSWLIFSNTRSTCRGREWEQAVVIESVATAWQGWLQRCGHLAAVREGWLQPGSRPAVAWQPGGSHRSPWADTNCARMHEQTHLWVVLVVEDGHGVLGALGDGGHDLRLVDGQHGR